MWKRYWFLIALAAVIPAGLLWPGGGAHLRQAGTILPLLVATTLCIAGFTLNTAHLLRQAANLPALLLGLSTTYCVAPLLAYGLALLWGPAISGPESAGFLFLQAVMIAAAQAGTLASAIALTAMARGDQGLAVVLTLSSNVLTVLLTPLVLKLSVGAVVYFPLGEMMRQMALVVVLPVLLGQVARRFLWRIAQPVLKPLRLIPQLIILVFVYCGFGAASDHLLADLRLMLQFLATCASLHALLLVWTWGATSLMGLAPALRAAVVFCGSQKTLPNGIYLWERFFAANPYGAVAAVLYHLIQLVVDTLVVPWIEPRKGGEEGPALGQ